MLSSRTNIVEKYSLSAFALASFVEYAVPFLYKIGIPVLSLRNDLT